MSDAHTRYGGRVVVGLIFFVLGFLLLFNNLEILDFNIPRFLFSWPVIFIIIGAVIILKSNDIAGYIFITLGSLFLLARYYNFNAWDFWPVVLIVIGFYILFNLRKTRTSGPFGHCKNDKGTEVNDDYIDEVAIFGGGKKVITSQNFHGGKTTAIFGGIELDFYDANLSPGENVVEITAIFGGVSFLIPRDWKIIMKLTPIFGGFSDERRRDPNLVQSSDKVLIIKGFVLFGGGEIKGA